MCGQSSLPSSDYVNLSALRQSIVQCLLRYETDARVKPAQDVPAKLIDLRHMTLHLNTQADLEAAIHALLKQDPRLIPIFEVAGMPALRRRSGPASAPPSIRWITTACVAPGRTVWAGSDCRRRRSRP